MKELNRLLLSVAALSFGLAGLLVVAWFAEGRLPLWTPGHMSYSADSLTVIQGQGRHTGDALVLTSGDSRGRAFVKVPSVVIDASSVLGLELIADPLPIGVRGSVYWRGSKDNRLGFKGFTLNSRDNIYIPLAGVKDWAGRVSEFGLMFHGRWDEPIRLRGVTAIPRTFMGKVQSYLAAISRPETWSHQTINFLEAVPKGGRASFTLVVAVILAFVVIFVALMLVRRNTRGAAGSVLFAAVVAIWLVFDARWQKVIVHNLADAETVYGNKSWVEKQSSAQDGYLYRHALEIKRTVLPEEPQRIFIVDDVEEQGFLPVRFHYHLLPHNVYSIGRKLPVAHVLPGDYVISLGKVSYMSFDKERSILTVDNEKAVPVRLVHGSGTGSISVFRVTSEPS